MKLVVERSARLRFTATVALAALSLVACLAEELAADSDAGVSIAVAPLTLPGITEATYTLTVENEAGQTVMTRSIGSRSYGDGDGSISYVASCDASSNPNTVTLTLTGVFEGSAGDVPIDPDSYRNPGPMPQSVNCVPNGDVSLTWDVTLVRAANQGFFDVAVSFNDIYCSAKVDCVDDEGDALALLFDANRERNRTVVVGLACTATRGEGTTHLYRDNLTIDCGAAGVATVDPSAGPGNLALNDGITDPSGRLFAAAVHRGEEHLGFDKVYWNVLLGLGAQTTACRLTTRATASDEPFDGQQTPLGTTWPVIYVDLNLTRADGALDCTRHPVNSDTAPGVQTDYTALDAPETFAYTFSPQSAPTLPPASDGTISGTDVVVNAYAAVTSDASAGATTLLVDADIAAAGDRVLVLQVQGSDTTAGTWEIADVATAGAGTLGLSAGLQNSYAASTGAVQVVRVARYAALTIDGSVTAPAWDGSTGGVVVIEGTSSITFSGAGAIDVDGKGFRGPARENLGHRNGRVGEGVLGNPLTRCVDNTTVSASGTGGCGAIEGTYNTNDGVAAAGGGANEAVPPNDGHTYQGSSRLFAQSGTAYLAGDFDVLVLGGAGGQGDSGSNDWAALAKGGDGGGIALLISPSIDTPVVTALGGVGEQACDHYGSGGDWGVSGGGGGAGGTIHLSGASVTGGTLTATGAAGGGICGHGDAQSRSGGAGRVRVEAPFSGTSSPAAN